MGRYLLGSLNGAVIGETKVRYGTKIIEVSFLMKELRLGGMVTTTSDGDLGGTRVPSSIMELTTRVKNAYEDDDSAVAHHSNNDDRDKKKKTARGYMIVLNVDGSVGHTQRDRDLYRTIQEAIDAAEDGDEIHIYPKPDGSSYKERVIIDKSVTLKGMKTSRVEAVLKSAARNKTILNKGGKNSGAKKASGMLSNLMSDLRQDELDDAEDRREKDKEDVAKRKGKKLEKKEVVIAYHDIDEDEPVVRCCAKNLALINISVKHRGEETMAAVFVSFGEVTLI